jgi:hypothetical protein
MEAASWLDLTNSESPEFIGRAAVALAADPDVIRHSGKALVAASVARDYGFTDVDGRTPRPLTLADVSFRRRLTKGQTSFNLVRTVGASVYRSRAPGPR